MGPNFSKTGSAWAMAKMKDIFFAEITKPDHKHSKNFYL